MKGLKSVFNDDWKLGVSFLGMFIHDVLYVLFRIIQVLFLNIFPLCIDRFSTIIHTAVNRKAVPLPRVYIERIEIVCVN